MNQTTGCVIEFEFQMNDHFFFFFFFLGLVCLMQYLAQTHPTKSSCYLKFKFSRASCIVPEFSRLHNTEIARKQVRQKNSSLADSIKPWKGQASGPGAGIQPPSAPLSRGLLSRGLCSCTSTNAGHHRGATRPRSQRGSRTQTGPGAELAAGAGVGGGGRY